MVDFAVPADHRVKESKKKNKYLDLARILKSVENESDDYTNYNWYSWYCHQRISTGTRGLVIRGRVETIQTL